MKSYFSFKFLLENTILESSRHFSNYIHRDINNVFRGGPKKMARWYVIQDQPKASSCFQSDGSSKVQFSKGEPGV